MAGRVEGFRGNFFSFAEEEGKKNRRGETPETKRKKLRPRRAEQGYREDRRIFASLFWRAIKGLRRALVASSQGRGRPKGQGATAVFFSFPPFLLLTSFFPFCLFHPSTFQQIEDTKSGNAVYSLRQVWMKGSLSEFEKWRAERREEEEAVAAAAEAAAEDAEAEMEVSSSGDDDDNENDPSSSSSGRARFNSMLAAAADAARRDEEGDGGGDGGGGERGRRKKSPPLLEPPSAAAADAAAAAASAPAGGSTRSSRRRTSLHLSSPAAIAAAAAAAAGAACRRAAGGAGRGSPKRPPPARIDAAADILCARCCSGHAESAVILCDGCDESGAHHLFCLSPPLARVPEGDWCGFFFRGFRRGRRRGRR